MVELNRRFFLDARLILIYYHYYNEFRRNCEDWMIIYFLF